MATETAAPYPVKLDIQRAEQQSRWRAFFRLPLSIPIFIFLNLLSTGVDGAIIAAILVRGSIPRWLFDFRIASSRWLYRAGAYVLLLTDEYAPFEGDYAVSYDVTYPDRLSRWKLVFWKFLTSVPHIIVLSVLALTLVVIVPIGWFAVLFTGKYPQGLHGYVTGIMRWSARVGAYTISLTDEFPPFSLSANAGAGSDSAQAFSAVAGVLATGGIVAGIVVAVIFSLGEDVVTDVSYERLVAGEVRAGEAVVEVNGWKLELVDGLDPANEVVGLLQPLPGHRLVIFTFFITNVSDNSDRTVGFLHRNDFDMVDAMMQERAPLLVVVGRRSTPERVRPHETVRVDAVFEVGTGTRPESVSFGGGGPFLDTAVFEFR